jgi:hypothetical protein
MKRIVIAVSALSLFLLALAAMPAYSSDKAPAKACAMAAAHTAQHDGGASCCKDMKESCCPEGCECCSGGACTCKDGACKCCKDGKCAPKSCEKACKKATPEKK